MATKKKTITIKPTVEILNATLERTQRNLNVELEKLSTILQPILSSTVPLINEPIDMFSKNDSQQQLFLKERISETRLQTYKIKDIIKRCQLQ